MPVQVGRGALHWAARGSGDGPTADCYEIEATIWDKLLNENYKTLLGELDEQQTAKARAMQRVWVSYRDTTCQFYEDKIKARWPIQCTPPASRVKRHGERCCSISSAVCKTDYC